MRSRHLRAQREDDQIVSISLIAEHASSKGSSISAERRMLLFVEISQRIGSAQRLVHIVPKEKAPQLLFGTEKKTNGKYMKYKKQRGGRR
jgi:hypothetical protein